MIDEDYFDDDQPVIRIAQNQKTKAQFKKNILKQAQQYLDDISEEEHQFLIQTLRDMAQEEKYFDVLADQLDQPVDA